MIRMLLRYKSWADALAFESVAAIPAEETYKLRATSFGSIIQTLNHVHIVDEIFRHHLQGLSHGFGARITPDPPPFTELAEASQATTDWFIGTYDKWSDADLGYTVAFEFIGGGQGSMTRAEIALHVVNHSTYHRGFVGDMLKQIPYDWPANDLTVFLRDHH